MGKYLEKFLFTIWLEMNVWYSGEVEEVWWRRCDNKYDGDSWDLHDN